MRQRDGLAVSIEGKYPCVTTRTVPLITIGFSFIIFYYIEILPDKIFHLNYICGKIISRTVNGNTHLLMRIAFARECPPDSSLLT